jgi:hypothetical protein
LPGSAWALAIACHVESFATSPLLKQESSLTKRARLLYFVFRVNACAVLLNYREQDIRLQRLREEVLDANLELVCRGLVLHTLGNASAISHAEALVVIKPGGIFYEEIKPADTVVTGLNRNTFGGAGVVEIPNMQRLLRFICEHGFEHHVAANLSSVAAAVHEAATRYLGWEMYWHQRQQGEC